MQLLPLPLLALVYLRLMKTRMSKILEMIPTTTLRGQEGLSDPRDQLDHRVEEEEESLPHTTSDVELQYLPNLSILPPVLHSLKLSFPKLPLNDPESKLRSPTTSCSAIWTKINTTTS